MAALFVVTSGSSGLTANTIKVPVLLYTGAATQCVITQTDVTFNGVTASDVPIQFEIATTSGSSSGGSIVTPYAVNPGSRAAAATVARINDTTEGGSPSVKAAWFIPPTSGFSIQYPLGREPGLAPSVFIEFRLRAPAAVSYVVNVWFEE